jgi:isoquinoline 1-oxidoreductase beta subunit
MITRRSFMTLSGAGGLLVLVAPACKSKEKKAGPTAVANEGLAPGLKSPGVAPPPIASRDGGEISAWLHVAENDVITYFVPEAEMGQGVHTAIPMVIGAELGAAWKFAKASTAPLNAAVFGKLSTGGSTSIRTGFAKFRQAGATARELLIAAGAKAMEAPVAECTTAESMVVWKAGSKSVRFGEVAKAASEIELDAPAKLRDSIKLGEPTPRLDCFEKVIGRVRYGMDVQAPNMLIGKSDHGPSVGATVAKVDDAGARAVAGVRDVVQTSHGVTVIADHTWAAMKGREALKVEWVEPNLSLSSEGISEMLRKASDKGITAYESGKAAAVLKGAATLVEAEYSLPYLAHAPMEPLACTARVDKDQCEIWTGSQSPTSVASTAARITGLAIEKIVVHPQLLGGGFGRRSQTDYVAEAVEAAKKSGKTVKLVWDREEDIRGGQYRPTAFNKMRAAVDKDKGKLLAWEHRIASPSILKQFGPLRGGIDGTSVDGVPKYGVPDMHMTYSDVDIPISTWFWRSVGHSQNGFVIDAFMNEAAKAAGRDPLEFRLDTKISRLNREGVAEDSPRLRKVLEVAAEKSGWGTALPEGFGRGIAACQSFGSFVAQVAVVSKKSGKLKVEKVYCVIDCGQVINPLTIRAQMDSGIAYGLSAALYGDIKIDKGRVTQGNFDSYRVVRMHEMPEVETTIIDSSEAHGGVGEPATPPIAAALAGAVLDIGGDPIRTLPVMRG